jgi:molecular chaperone DnaK (HSP70)
MSKTSPIIGIDLGTTHSLVAVAENGTARILKDGDSSLIPSVVSYHPDGRVSAVGWRARTLRSVDPKSVVYSTKRFMGKGRADLEILQRDYPFDLAASDDEMIRIKVGPRQITPIEVASEILKRCAFIAENQLGVPIKKVVVTVPAYFNDAQRVATAVAAKVAGLEVVRIINEPTAAALAYGIGSQSAPKKVVVYDFGGGTFDVSLLKVTDGVFEVVATDGDSDLGGDDLDRALVEVLLEKAQRKPDSPEDWALLAAQAEEVKRQLSDSDQLDCSLHWSGQIQWEGEISRHDFESAALPWVERSLKLVAKAMAVAGWTAEEVDDVIMVGGSTRVPLVKQKVKEFFKKELHDHLNPDEVVALGAALQGSVLAGQEKRALLLDVVPLSLGLETMGGVVSKIIPRNTTIPCSVTEGYTTSVDNQTAIDLHILQGERELVKDCRSLARFKFKIPPQPAGIPKILITFSMDASGVLRVSALDDRTKESTELEVKPSFGLSDEAVEKMLKDAWDHAEKDFEERQLIEARNQAAALIQAVKKSLQSPVLDPSYKAAESRKLEPVIKALEVDLKSAGKQVILLRTKELDGLTQDLARRILDASVRQRLQHQSVNSAL